MTQMTLSRLNNLQPFLECVHHAFSEYARNRPEVIAVERQSRINTWTAAARTNLDEHPELSGYTWGSVNGLLFNTRSPWWSPILLYSTIEPNTAGKEFSVRVANAKRWML